MRGPHNLQRSKPGGQTSVVWCISSGVALIDDRYRLGAQIGADGSGEVFEAEQVRLGRKVTIKMLEKGRSPDDVERFLREARVLAKLHHPGIVYIADFGVHEGRPYLVREGVGGRSLEDVLRDKGRLIPEAALMIMLQIAEALEHAHASGVVHRGLCPQNIQIDEEGRARITEFGVARFVQDVETLTAPGVVVGASQYMSPEQAKGKPVDARTDLYALGVIGYRAIAGRLPFQAMTLAELLGMQALQEPTPLAEAALVPKEAYQGCAIVDRLLERDPERRYPSATWVVNAIRAAQGELTLPDATFDAQSFHGVRGTETDASSGPKSDIEAKIAALPVLDLEPNKAMQLPSFEAPPPFQPPPLPASQPPAPSAPPPIPMRNVELKTRRGSQLESVEEDGIELPLIDEGPDGIPPEMRYTPTPLSAQMPGILPPPIPPPTPASSEVRELLDPLGVDLSHPGTSTDHGIERPAPVAHTDQDLAADLSREFRVMDRLRERAKRAEEALEEPPPPSAFRRLVSFVAWIGPYAMLGVAAAMVWPRIELAPTPADEARAQVRSGHAPDAVERLLLRAQKSSDPSLHAAVGYAAVHASDPRRAIEHFDLAAAQGAAAFSPADITALAALVATDDASSLDAERILKKLGRVSIEPLEKLWGASSIDPYIRCRAGEALESLGEKTDTLGPCLGALKSGRCGVRAILAKRFAEKKEKRALADLEALARSRVASPASACAEQDAADAVAAIRSK
jgi:serine/threonine protein kinase